MSFFEILRKTPDCWRPQMGFMDSKGNVVIEPRFLGTPWPIERRFSDAGYALVQPIGVNQHLVLDELGDTVFELPKDHVPMPFTRPDEHGIFGVMHRVDAGNSDLWKLEGRDWVFLGVTRYYAMRIDGSIAFEAYIRNSGHGHHVFSHGPRMNEKLGLMNEDGQVTIAPIYDSISLSRTDPFATVWAEGSANVVALDGAPVFRCDFDVERSNDVRPVDDGLWVVPNPTTGQADVYDIVSVEVAGHLPMTYWSHMIPRACPRLCGGVVCIKHPRKGSTYYRPDGNALMPGILKRPRWFAPEMRASYFNDGRASFKLGELWGYMDLEGTHVIPPQFKSNFPFQHGLVRVKYLEDGNSWDRFTYVDRDGVVVWHQED